MHCPNIGSRVTPPYNRQSVRTPVHEDIITAFTRSGEAEVGPSSDEKYCHIGSKSIHATLNSVAATE